MRRNQAVAARGAFALAAVLGAGCALPPRVVDDFGAWRAERAELVQALEAHLAQQGLAEVLPLPQLLRSASSWQACGAAPWALPPAAQWPALVSVLRLVQALRHEGVIGDITVHSGWREAALNACAGGAARSAHLTAFAIDFTPPMAAKSPPACAPSGASRGATGAWAWGATRRGASTSTPRASGPGAGATAATRAARLEPQALWLAR